MNRIEGSGMGPLEYLLPSNLCAAALGSAAGAWSVAIRIACPPAGFLFAGGMGYFSSKAFESVGNWFA